MQNSKFKNKVVCFLTSLQNAYKDDEDKEDFPRLDFKQEELTEDFTAMLMALFVLYTRITGEDADLIGFTHILNRLALQHILNKEEKTW